MHRRATPRLYKIGGVRDTWPPRRYLEETLDLFSSSPLKRSLGHTDHVGRCIIVRKEWWDDRGSALIPHIRCQARRKAHGRPRH